MTSKGQVTLPKAVRDALGLKPGSEVEFVIDQNRLVLRRQLPPDRFERWRGYLKDSLGGLTVDELMTEMRGEPDGIEEPPPSSRNCRW